MEGRSNPASRKFDQLAVLRAQRRSAVRDATAALKHKVE